MFAPEVEESAMNEMIFHVSLNCITYIDIFNILTKTPGVIFICLVVLYVNLNSHTVTLVYKVLLPVMLIRTAILTLEIVTYIKQVHPIRAFVENNLSCIMRA